MTKSPKIAIEVKIDGKWQRLPRGVAPGKVLRTARDAERWLVNALCQYGWTDPLRAVERPSGVVHRVVLRHKGGSRVFVGRDGDSAHADYVVPCSGALSGSRCKFGVNRTTGKCRKKGK